MIFFTLSSIAILLLLCCVLPILERALRLAPRGGASGVHSPVDVEDLAGDVARRRRSEKERRLLFHDNAIRVYRLEEPRNSEL